MSNFDTFWREENESELAFDESRAREDRENIEYWEDSL